MFRLVSSIVGLMLAGSLAASPAFAAYDQDSPPPVDAPPLTAARVSYAEGNVQIWRSDEDGNSAWDAAMVNDIVTTQTGLFTGGDARAEVRWGPHALRLGQDSRGGFSQIGFDRATFNLEGGTINLRLRADDGASAVAVTVAGMRVDLRVPGRYRIDAIDGRPLRITVFSGHAGLQSASNVLTIDKNQALDVGPNGSSFAYAPVISTALDEWSRGRDEVARDAPAARYVSPYMTGYESLDQYGTWTNDPYYGPVWAPTVIVAGWAPYRYGRWRWVAPWGWTWIDDAPWGFAPFHYGRWVMIGAHWCWWPGQRIVRPVYAPALVGWVGNAGWSVSVSVGGPAYVGWYPLAPWHEYRPQYTTNITYIQQVNTVVIRDRPRGAPEWHEDAGRTIVPGHDFRAPISRAVMPTNPPIGHNELRPVAPPPPRTGFVPRSGEDRNAGRVPTPRIERGPAVVEPAPANRNVAPPRTVTPPTQPGMTQPQPVPRPETPRKLLPPEPARPYTQPVVPQSPAVMRAPGNERRAVSEPPARATIPQGEVREAPRVVPPPQPQKVQPVPERAPAQSSGRAEEPGRVRAQREGGNQEKAREGGGERQNWKQGRD